MFQRRKPEPQTNPWDALPALSGWVPTSPTLDLFALMTSLARNQWELARMFEDYTDFVRRTYWRLFWIALVPLWIANLVYSGPGLWELLSRLWR